MTGRERSAKGVSHLATQVRGDDDSWLQSVDKEDLEHLKLATDEDGRTLLHTLSAVGRTDLLQHVEEHGFMEAVNKADAEGWTPLLSGVFCLFCSSVRSTSHGFRSHSVGCCSGECWP